MSNILELGTSDRFETVEWLDAQLSFDFLQEISDYLEKGPVVRPRQDSQSKENLSADGEDWIFEQLGLGFQQRFEGDLISPALTESDDTRLIADDDSYKIDDETIANWVANLGPFDLARAMLLEAVRDLQSDSIEDRESAQNWINSTDKLLGFDTCVQWLTDLCVPPRQKMEIELPSMEERVEHLRDMCLNRPLEVLHLLKNFEDWSQYSKLKLEQIRQQYDESESEHTRASMAFKG